MPIHIKGDLSMKDCFFGTEHELPNGWQCYGPQDYMRQEYWCPVRTMGRRCIHFHIIIDGGKMTFNTLYREHFKREHVDLLIERAMDFYREYLKAKEEMTQSEAV